METGIFEAKYFDELTTAELYAILKSRAELFVVEQNCVYQDLDDRDFQALHVFCTMNGRVAANLRAFRKDGKTVQMGRVLTLQHGTGLGGTLLKAGIKAIRKNFIRSVFILRPSVMPPAIMRRQDFRSVRKNFWKMEYRMWE